MLIVEMFALQDIGILLESVILVQSNVMQLSDVQQVLVVIVSLVILLTGITLEHAIRVTLFAMHLRDVVEERLSTVLSAS